MSENEDGSKVIQGAFRKGFRQTPKPTKGTVMKENQALAQKLTNQLQFLQQQTINMLMQQRKDKMELISMTNLLRCEKSMMPIKKKDLVMIDFVGRLVNENGELGKLFDGSFGKGYIVEMGENSLIDGFEDNLYDKVFGDVVTAEVTFPKKYNESLKGKKASFNVKIIGVWKAVDEHNVIETLYMDLLKAEKDAKEEEEKVKTPPKK